MFAPPEQPCPPLAYGGAERIIDVWVRKLIDRGHKVDLYAGPGSTCPATNTFLARSPAMAEEVYLAALILERNPMYDAVIDYSANHLAGQHCERVVSIMGGDPFRKYPHDEVRNRVYVSRAFADFNHAWNHPVIVEALTYDPKGVPLVTPDKEIMAFIGLVHPMKGIHMAAGACRRTGRRLHVWGPVRDEGYFRALMNIGSGDYHGVLMQDGRDEAFGASVFFHPTIICDASPLAPREAMLRGTPVIAGPVGGVLESVSPGISGCFATTVKEFIDAIPLALTLDRSQVKRAAERYNDPDASTDVLEALCTAAAKGRVW